MLKKRSLFFFLICLHSSPLHARDQTLQGYAELVQSEVTELMSFNEGKGTGELARYMARLQVRLAEYAEATDVSESKFTFQNFRSFILEETKGEGLVVPVMQYPRAIEQGNIRLKRSGIDFIHLVQAPGAAETLSPIENPLSQHQEKYDRFTKARLAVSIGIALIGGFAGSGGSIPGTVGAASAGGLEYQFAKLSRHWAKFWDRFGFPGNIAVNALYGVVVSSVILATEVALSRPPSLNLQEFLVKSVLIGATTFSASFGAMQIASAKMLQRGEFSEYGRFRLENYSVFLNSFGRMIALGAAGLGIQYEVASLYGVSFGVGELIGWGVQLAYLAGVTAPFWLKLTLGEKIQDRVTAYKLKHLKDPNHTWNRSFFGSLRRSCALMIAKVTDAYTPNRL